MDRRTLITGFAVVILHFRSVQADGCRERGPGHPSRGSVQPAKTRRSQLSRAEIAACETIASGEKPEKP